MKLKIGDKVYCKKQMKESDKIWFYQNKYYEIVGVGVCWVNISSEIKAYPTITVPVSLITKHDSVLSGEGNNYFDDYFLTEKELRKEKLDELM